MFPKHPESSLRVSEECFQCLSEFLGFLSVQKVAWGFLKEHWASIHRIPRVRLGMFPKSVLECSESASRDFHMCPKSIWKCLNSFQSVQRLSSDFAQTFQNVFLVSRVFPEYLERCLIVSGACHKNVCSCWRVSKELSACPKSCQETLDTLQTPSEHSCKLSNISWTLSNVVVYVLHIQPQIL